MNSSEYTPLKGNLSMAQSICMHNVLNQEEETIHIFPCGDTGTLPLIRSACFKLPYPG